MRVDVYRRFEVDVVREADGWTPYRRGADGKRARLREVAPWADDVALEVILADLEAAFHEWGGPDRALRVVETWPLSDD